VTRKKTLFEREMCLFANEVADVKNTQICVLPNGSDRQITVYSCDITKGSQKSNALILPVPNPDNDESKIKLYDLSERPDFFDKLNSRVISKGRSLHSNSSYAAPDSFVAVQQIGSYEVSVAETLEDLKRIDPKLLEIEPALLKLLQEKYCDPTSSRCDWSFVVAKFDHQQKFHPFAYSHPLQKTGWFIPTSHFHSKTYNDYEKFDHDIYVANALADGGMLAKDWKQALFDLCDGLMPVRVQDLYRFNVFELKGTFRNTDLQLPVSKQSPEWFGNYISSLRLNKNTFKSFADFDSTASSQPPSSTVAAAKVDAIALAKAAVFIPATSASSVTASGFKEVDPMTLDKLWSF
jgi:hypothetical protein